MADLEYATCPYNKHHRILKFRMPGHIMKCMKNYRGQPLAICKYNATHRFPPDQIEQHLMDNRKFNAYQNIQIAYGQRDLPQN